MSELLSEHEKSDLYLFLSTFKEKGPEYRAICFPGNLLVVLWEKIFCKKIGSEDMDKNIYLWELNKYFIGIGSNEANKLLDDLEDNNKTIMFEHYKNLLKLIEIFKIEFIKGKIDSFLIVINDDDTIIDLKKKISDKEDKLKEFLIMEGRRFISDIGFSRLNNDDITAQIVNMVYIAIRYIIKDDYFLNKLLKVNQGNSGNDIKPQETKGLIIDILAL